MALPFDRRTVAPCNFNETCFDDPLSDSDERCLDPVFAANNPEICGTSPIRLIIKPEAVSRCTDEPVEFDTYLVAGGAEQLISNGLTYISSNQDVVLVSGLTGNATVTGEGIATVTVTWQNLTASAQVTGLGEECCEDQNVGMMLTLDNSVSMGQAFSATYGTKFILAKELAAQIAADLNTTKDQMGVISFNDAANLELDLSDDISDIQTAVGSIGLTAGSTNLYDALEKAITTLDADTTLERKVIILFSDGVNKAGENPFNIAHTFKSGGGIIIVVGLRASGTGFTLLNQISSGGFFINATEDNEEEVIGFLRGMKGYFCAGNCTPPGDVTVPKARLNYDSFINWDAPVAVGPVDLIGGTFPHQYFDFLPGNGLYVDLAGSSIPWKGKMTTKVSFALAAEDYELRLSIGGNQRVDRTGFTVRVTVGTVLDETITVDNWKQDFTDYTFPFTVAAPENATIYIETLVLPGNQSFGLLLNEVELTNTTTDTQVFYDNFDEENLTYIPPACGEAYDEDAGYGYGYDCYGYGCLENPVPAQEPDSEPLPDIE
jgi:hypothetical protein